MFLTELRVEPGTPVQGLVSCMLSTKLLSLHPLVPLTEYFTLSFSEQVERMEAIRAKNVNAIKTELRRVLDVQNKMFAIAVLANQYQESWVESVSVTIMRYS